MLPTLTEAPLLFALASKRRNRSIVPPGECFGSAMSLLKDRVASNVQKTRDICAVECGILGNELAALTSSKNALVVEGQIPIALEIQELLTDHGAADVRIAASLREARRVLATGFRPHLAVIDLARFDEDANDLVAFLQGENIALVLTMVTADTRRPEERERTIILTKPYVEFELKNALIEALRAGEGGDA